MKATRNLIKARRQEKNVLRNFKLIAATILLASLPLGAQAATVTYDFTAAATSGPLAGDAASGSLSFDGSLLAVPNINYAQAGLLTDLSFTWDGTTFNASTANTGEISSGAAGQLALLAFGDNCSASGCIANVANPNDWFVSYSFADQTGRFVYANSAGSYVSSDVTFSPIPTPLPASAWLLLSGALAVALFRTGRLTSNPGLQLKGAI
jgi:hypothetical protein